MNEKVKRVMENSFMASPTENCKVTSTSNFLSVLNTR